MQVDETIADTQQQVNLERNKKESEERKFDASTITMDALDEEVKRYGEHDAKSIPNHLDEKIKQLEYTNAMYLGRLQQLEENEECIRKEIENYKTKLRSMKEEIRTKRDKIEVLQDKLVYLKHAKQLLESAIQNRDDELESKDQELISCNKKLKENQSVTRDEVESELAKLKDKIADYKKKNHTSQKA